MEQVALELEANAKYLWGGYDERVGMPGDCSAKVTAIYRRSGRYDLTRCRAKDMAEGLCGWDGELEYFEEAKACALMFMDLLDKGEVSHVGILARDTFQEFVNLLAHASSSKGFIQVIVEKDKNNIFYRKSRGFKYLNTKDKG